MIVKTLNYFLFFLCINELSFIAFQTYYYQVLCAENIIGELTSEVLTLDESLILGPGGEEWWTQGCNLSVWESLDSIALVDWSDHLQLVSGVDTESVYCIFFSTQVMPLGEEKLKFWVLQQKVYGVPGELVLVFFRLANNFNHDLHGVTVYNVTPHDLSVYLVKLQCFCFEEINIRSGESIDLPVILYLDKRIQFDVLPLKFLAVEYTLLWNSI